MVPGAVGASQHPGTVSRSGRRPTHVGRAGFQLVSAAADTILGL